MPAISRSFINRLLVFGIALLTARAQPAMAQQVADMHNRYAFDVYAKKNAAAYNPAINYYVAESNHFKTMEVIRQLDERTAIVKINTALQFNSIKQYARIAPANDDWKLSPAIKNLSPGKQQVFIVAGLNSTTLLPALKKIDPRLEIIYTEPLSHSVLIRTNAKFLLGKISPLREVVFIDQQQKATAETGIIGYDRSFHGINTLDYSIPGASGRNTVVGVKEQRMEAADLDLYKRVLNSPIAAATTTNHATVIASIIGGAGNIFYDGRGIAHGCSFFPSSFNNIFPDDAVVLNNNKVTVQNHSYGTVIQQFYGAEALAYDAQLWNNKNLLHVFSAGNQGTAAAGEGKYANLPGYANLTGNFKMAKNLVTVAAIDNKENIPAESSAGPLYDGRIAPQLTALGPNGTSDAAAMVSGTIAVLQQVYADSNGQSIPPASVVKALLYNNTDAVSNKNIAYKTGYGILNSYASVKALQQKKYDGAAVAQGQSWTKTITLPANITLFKVTLAWTDTAAGLNNNKALLNDLDLEIKELGSGTIFRPWCLSVAAHADSLAKPAVRKRDSLNTAEQVTITLPAAGTYEIKVTGTSLVNASVPFHIAYLADTLHTFAFTSPQHASDLNRDEQPDIFIRWKAAVANSSETGNLYISYNDGLAWELIKTGVDLSANKYKWAIKDTASRALLKMETAFGDFLSKDFLISKVTRLNVDFLCTDSFRLSWNKHIYAAGYKLFCLTDSPYLKQLLTVTDTFITLNRTAYPSPVYAVEPLLSNNIPATRSLALDISLQGVKCFYNTLYYTLQDPNLLNLVLELSLPAYVDSIFFEQVTVNGQLIKRYDGKKATAASATYTQAENDPPPGTSYWRAKMKLKDGRIIYTETISVQTSGRRFVIFYPNPVSRNGTLNYIMQQGVPPGSRLALYDASGRFLKSYFQSDPVDVSKLPAGLIIYKLITNDNKILETDKLVIR